MPANLIVLTNGLSGSSVLTGLIAQAGYWTGSQTISKQDYATQAYDTHESADLVQLNQNILSHFGVGDEYHHRFLPASIEAISAGADELDHQPFIKFLQQSEQHQPWILKDPRFWLTIRFWNQLYDFSQTKFILLYRDYRQSWISSTLRRTIQSPAYCHHYDSSIQNTLKSFLQETKLQHIDLQYEKLILQPEGEIERINQFLGTDLCLEHLKSTFKGELYKLPRGYIDHLKAWGIYLKLKFRG